MAEEEPPNGLKSSEDIVSCGNMEIKPWGASLLPKHETMAHAFLKNNPSYDGRGVTVGILDTGIDPAAAGLQKTSTGLPKVVDLVECSGCGDVDISTEVTLSCDDDKNTVYEVTGLSGRKLLLNPSWKIDGNKVKLGIKAAYELYPGKLRKRVKASRLKRFNEHQRQHASEVRVKLEALDDIATNKRERDNLKEILKVLEEQDESFELDPGPIFDCVVFYDGESWKAVIDTEEKGDLTEYVPMSDFKQKRQHRILGTDDVHFNYSVNIFVKENILSIFSDAGAHGTHVAGITSAYFSEDSIVNGVAPGAQLIGLKVGDSRLGSMETGTSFTRCLIESIRRGCDVINLSYGEAASICNTGRHAKLVKELVRKHNVIFIASAGNNGPALSTVGAPGTSIDDIISVGAFVSRDMMVNSYSLIPEETKAHDQNYNAHTHGVTYTWSSVGPTLDGAQGVDIMAPGAAITCVPEWTLQKSQLMNGTSMSSPNLTGCVAILVSACKQNDIKYSPDSIRRAILNTASFIEGMSPLQQGAGMINVEAAWEYLKRMSKSEDFVKFEVSVDRNQRGIYIRSNHLVKSRHVVTINPTWFEDDVNRHGLRIQAEWHLSIICSHEWVQCPSKMLLVHNGRSFGVTVDPSKLEPGLNYASIYVLDDNTNETLVTIPVTVIVPHISDACSVDLGSHLFAPAEAKRFFLSPARGSTFMDIHITSVNTDENATASAQTLVLHTIQLLPQSPYRAHQVKKYMNLSGKSPTFIISVPIEENYIVELCLARYWSSVGIFHLSFQVNFRGITPSTTSLCMSSNRPVIHTTLSSILRDEMLAVNAKLQVWKVALRPIEPGNAILLGSRDIFPDDRQIYQMILSYEINLEGGKFTPRIPTLQGFLYEAAFESQMIMCFDENKKLLGIADSWPGEIEVKSKGKITIKVQIRHDNPILLEKYKHLEIFIERKLKDPINLSVYNSHEDLIESSNFQKRLLKKGSSDAIFISGPPQTKLPKQAKVGDIIEGTITYCQARDSSVGGGKRPGGFPLQYIVGPSSNERQEKTNVESQEKKWEELLECEIARTKCDFLEKNSSLKEEDYLTAYKTFVTEHPSCLKLKVVALKYFYRGSQDSKRSKEKLIKVIDICRELLSQIEEDKVAIHFGITHDRSIPTVERECKEMEEQKGHLIDALIYRSMALFELESMEEEKHNFSETFETSLRDVKKWVAPGTLETKFLKLNLMKENKMAGIMLKCLGSEIKDSDFGEKQRRERRIDIFRQQQFDHLVELEKAKLIVDFPKHYTPF